MTLRKRLRQIHAALTQEWRHQSCHRCGLRWLTTGPGAETHLCATCETRELATMLHELHLRTGKGLL